MNSGPHCRAGGRRLPVAGGQTRTDGRPGTSGHRHTPVTTFSEARFHYLEGSHHPQAAQAPATGDALGLWGRNRVLFQRNGPALTASSLQRAPSAWSPGQENRMEGKQQAKPCALQPAQQHTPPAAQTPSPEDRVRESRATCVPSVLSACSVALDMCAVGIYTAYRPLGITLPSERSVW